MSRYVPPALRKQALSPDAPSTAISKPPVSRSTPSYTLNELRNYYFPSNIDDDASSTSQTSKTLHDSAATPGKLSHVLLFRNANPRWESDGIIYTKSSLELLPTELVESTMQSDTATPTADQHQEIIHQKSSPPLETTKSTTTTPPATQCTLSADFPPSTDPISLAQSQPIAAYSQISGSSHTHSVFEFAGYYTITNLQFLQPHTADLIRMLEQKWTFTNLKSGKSHSKARNKESWGKSLDFKWAVIKLAKDEATLQTRGAPKIEKLDLEDPVEKKSVNEMLREMRVGKKGSDTSPAVQTQTATEDDDDDDDETPTPPQEIRQAPTRQPRAPTEGAMFGSKTNKIEG